MSKLRNQAALGLKAGDRFVFSRTFTRAETEAFGDLTRDYNPVHYDRGFAAGKGFPGLICHGLLVGSMLCQIGGQVGWLATEMNFKYLKPVFFGDRITCTLTITSIGDRQQARAEVEMVNQDGVRVITADLRGRLPNHRERAYLGRMVETGDPTNRLAERTDQPGE